MRRSTVLTLTVVLTTLMLACRDSGPPQPVRIHSVPDAKPETTSVQPPAELTAVKPQPPAPKSVNAPPPQPSPLGALAYVASTDGPFPSASDKAGPRLVLHIETEFDHAGRDALANKLVDGDRFAPLDDAAVAQVEITPPRNVWLFGAEGPCAAKIGSAYAIAYQDGVRALELGYLLEPCTQDFAPVAMLGHPALPVKAPPASWIAATITTDEKVDGDWAAWKHDKRAGFEVMEALNWTPQPDEPRRPSLHVRVREAGPTVELGFAWHQPGPACEESEHVEIAIGLWALGRFTALPPINPDYGDLDAELVGILALAEQPLVIVARQDFQMYLSVLTDAGFGAWTSVSTGEYHDEVVASAGWSVLDHDCGP